MGKRQAKSGETLVAPGPDQAVGMRTRRRNVWMVAAALVAVGGTAGGAFAARAVARNDADKSLQEFEQSSAEVASTLQLAIQHEEDLIESAGAFILSNPDATNAEFVEWATALHWSDRYPEVGGFGELVIVAAADLPAFAARAQAHPVRPLGPGGAFRVVPPGDRPYYCLSTLSMTRDSAPPLPVGFDFCAGDLGAPNMTARDTGQGSYHPFDQEGTTLLGIVTPLYQRGVVPTTVDARRDAFVGWVGMTVDPSQIVERSLVGHPGTAVTLHYRGGASTADFSSGEVSGAARSFLVDLHNGWTVETFAAAGSDSLWQNGNALALLVAGVALSLLLAALILVLASGRARALRLVAERTGELRDAQAKLVDGARQAGMAEIATNVLHNVGNVLNSVNVSANLVRQKMRQSKSAGLAKAVALLHDHADDLGEFLTIDARGKALPAYLDKLAVTLAAERESIDEELSRLTTSVGHIKEIVSAQQSLAGVSSVIEPVTINDLVEDALRMAGMVGRDDVTIVREFPDASLISLDRHRILLILVNVITNASHAMQHKNNRQLRIRIELDRGRTVSVAVTDNGKGILTENLTRIFNHGFTTHTAGHGFGLHSSALAAQEIGGTLTAHSNGTDTGATFTLQIPLQTREAAA